MDVPVAISLPSELAGFPDPADPAALAAHLATIDVPLSGDGRTTFLYAGPADRVALKHWMDEFPPLPAFTNVSGTDLWYLTVTLPEGSRIEYKIDVVRDGRHHLILDPLNPDRARDPFGSNSVVAGPGYQRPAWTRPQPGVPTGRLEELEVASAALGGTRAVQVYLPAGYPQRAGHPLVVAHDGSDYLAYAALRTVLDNLIHAGEIESVVVALVDPGHRNREYTGDARHADFLADELLPALEGGFALDARPDRRALLGASLGGVASLHAAWRHPRVWSRLLLQSGSFVTALGGRYHRGRVFAPVVAFMGRFLADPGPPPERAYLSCGRYDGLAADNRRMSAVLADLGVAVTYEEVLDGHNWENWRDRLRAGLTALFPGPVPPPPG